MPITKEIKYRILRARIEHLKDVEAGTPKAEQLKILHELAEEFGSSMAQPTDPASILKFTYAE